MKTATQWATKYCPKIDANCLQDECMFWQGFYNANGEKDYNCQYLWRNILLTEVIGAINKKV